MEHHFFNIMGIFILLLYLVSFFIACLFVGGILGLCYFLIENLSQYAYLNIKEYFYPTPVLPAEVKAQVLEEAGAFVHAKHRVGEHDYFHEYLWVANERLSMKWEEMYGSN